MPTTATSGIDLQGYAQTRGFASSGPRARRSLAGNQEELAMTRAKDDLHLIAPQRFFTHGQSAQGDGHLYASRTRFIPDGLLGLFDRTSWPAVGVGAPERVASGVRVNIGARMRGRWR
jgi:hypothetical protein